MPSNIWPRLAEMGKQDSSWRRVRVQVKCVVLVLLLGHCASGKQMSETLQRALSAVRGPSPGAKKLLNIPEDGGKYTEVSIVLSNNSGRRLRRKGEDPRSEST